MNVDSATTSHNDTTSVKSSETSRTAENELVAHHYNQRPEQTFKQRRNSPIKVLRDLNNWIKACLISDFTRSGDFVLDIGGGKGGDLNKWHKARIEHVVLADVAENSVKDAMGRYNVEVRRKDRDPRAYRFSATWIAGDCFHPSIRRELEHVDFFDVVSCQFAMHYSFESEARAKDFLGNVVYRLRPGGYFIGTTPDARVLYRRALASTDGKTFGNSFYSVKFDKKVEQIDTTQASSSSDGKGLDTKESEGKSEVARIENGERYIFSLTEAVQDVAEYIVDPDILVQWCSELDLELVRMENFQEMFEKEVKAAHGKSNGSAGAPPARESLDDDTWETFGVYMAFVFRKKGRAQSTKHTCKRFPVATVDPSRDLILLPTS